MSEPCWTFREEAFGWPDDELARGRCLKTMPADYHAPGLPPEHVDDEYGCVACAYDWVEGMCEMDAGHDGPHEFTSAGLIVLALPVTVVDRAPLRLRPEDPAEDDWQRWQAEQFARTLPPSLAQACLYEPSLDPAPRRWAWREIAILAALTVTGLLALVGLGAVVWLVGRVAG